MEVYLASEETTANPDVYGRKEEKQKAAFPSASADGKMSRAEVNSSEVIIYLVGLFSLHV